MSTTTMSNGSPATAATDDREQLAQAMVAHKRGETVEELAEQAETLRRVLAKLYTAPSTDLANPVWRDDLAFELSSILRVLNDAVANMDGTIELDAS